MVKCLMFKNYGLYGSNIHQKIYDYIALEYGEGKAESILESSDYGKYYLIRDYNNSGTRFNSILIEAFENTDDIYHKGYEVVEGYFECDVYDGKESNGRLVFY